MSARVTRSARAAALQRQAREEEGATAEGSSPPVVLSPARTATTRRSTRRAARDAAVAIALESQQSRRSARIAAADAAAATATGSGSLLTPLRLRSKKTDPPIDEEADGKPPAASPAAAVAGGKTAGLDPDSPPPADFVCPICLDRPSKMSDVASISGCTHRFCWDCIGKWAETENRCPCCKARYYTIDRVVPLAPAPAASAKRGKRKRGKSPGSARKRARASPDGGTGGGAVEPVNTRTIAEDRTQRSGVPINAALIEQILASFAGVGGGPVQFGQGGDGRPAIRMVPDPNGSGQMVGVLEIVVPEGGIGGFAAGGAGTGGGDPPRGIGRLATGLGGGPSAGGGGGPPSGAMAPAARGRGGRGAGGSSSAPSRSGVASTAATAGSSQSFRGGVRYPRIASIRDGAQVPSRGSAPSIRDGARPPIPATTGGVGLRRLIVRGSVGEPRSNVGQGLFLVANVLKNTPTAPRPTEPSESILERLAPASRRTAGSASAAAALGSPPSRAGRRQSFGSDVSSPGSPMLPSPTEMMAGINAAVAARRQQRQRSSSAATARRRSSSSSAGSSGTGGISGLTRRSSSSGPLSGGPGGLDSMPNLAALLQHVRNRATREGGRGASSSSSAAAPPAPAAALAPGQQRVTIRIMARPTNGSSAPSSGAPAAAAASGSPSGRSPGGRRSRTPGRRS